MTLLHRTKAKLLVSSPRDIVRDHLHLEEMLGGSEGTLDHAEVKDKAYTPNNKVKTDCS